MKELRVHMKKSFGTFLVLCTYTFSFFTNLSWGAEGQRESEPIVAAYYENWSQYRPGVGGRQQFTPHNIDPTILTDLYYAFGIFGYVTKSVNPDNPHVTGDYTIQPVEWNDQTILYPAVQGLKHQNPQLRVILSIGGWGFNDPNDPNQIGTHTHTLFSQMVASPENRAQFIQSAISYAHRYGFDGIDIDWEYPGDMTRGGREDDFDNFIQFLQEMRTACKSVTPALLLTYASPAIVPSGVPEKYRVNTSLYFQWLARCSEYLDRMNVMAYDYHGPFDTPKYTGVNAPFQRDVDPSSNLYVMKTVQNYLENGVPPEKIVLGIPTYGHSYGGVTQMTVSDNGPGKPFTTEGNPGSGTQSPGLLAYFEITDMTALQKLTFGTDTTTNTSYAYDISSQQWVSFETPETTAVKARAAKDQGLLGVMFWAVDNDEYEWGEKFPNIRQAYKIFYPKTEVASQ